MKTKVCVILSFKNFIEWLSVLLARSRIDAISAIQDSDPYLEGLLATAHRIKQKALHGRNFTVSLRR